MSIRSLLVSLPLLIGLLHTGCAMAESAAKTLRYRGDYTRGHEVNSFCPEVTAACYWVGGTTDMNTQRQLSALAQQRTSMPYQSICVMLEGAIDKVSPREGFVAEYDGLISVRRLLGACDDTELLTHGDLQHHRWVLESVNGSPIVAEQLDHRVPELDFGERMHVAGNTGCNSFTGTAVLHDAFMTIESMVTTARSCTSAQNRLEEQVRIVLISGPVITLGEDRSLTLRAADYELHFRLRDWLR